MKNTKFRISVLVVSFVLLLGIFIVNVGAIGIGFSQTVKVYPGQKYDAAFSLQNVPAGEGDLTFKGTIEEGGEYISFTGGSEFVVPDGGIVHAGYRIGIPSSASVGDKYKVRAVFNAVPVSPEESSGGGDAVQFTTGVGVTFDIEVVERPPEPVEPVIPETGGAGISLWVWVLVGVIVLILIVWMIMKSKKSE